MTFISKDTNNKENLDAVNVNVIEILDLNIDKSNRTLLNAWNIVKKHFVDNNACWSTIGYVTKE